MAWLNWVIIIKSNNFSVIKGVGNIVGEFECVCNIVGEFECVGNIVGEFSKLYSHVFSFTLKFIK